MGFMGQKPHETNVTLQFHDEFHCRTFSPKKSGMNIKDWCNDSRWWKQTIFHGKIFWFSTLQNKMFQLRAVLWLKMWSHECRLLILLSSPAPPRERPKTNSWLPSMPQGRCLLHLTSQSLLKKHLSSLGINCNFASKRISTKEAFKKTQYMIIEDLGFWGGAADASK